VTSEPVVRRNMRWAVPPPGNRVFVEPRLRVLE
jgi:hypothetical protein